MCVHFYVCKRSLELFSTVRICFGESKSIIINLKVKKKQLPDKTFQPTMDQPFYTHLLGDRWPAAKTVCRLSVGKFLVTDSSLIFLPYIFPKQCWMYTFTLLDRNMCSQKFLPNLVPACSTLKSGLQHLEKWLAAPWKVAAIAPIAIIFVHYIATVM